MRSQSGIGNASQSDTPIFHDKLEDALAELKKNNPSSSKQEEIKLAIQPRESKEPIEEIPSHLNYFLSFTKPEIKALLTRYPQLEVKNLADLNKLIHQHKCIYRFLNGSLITAILLNLGYVGFVRNTGGQGFQTIVHTFKNDAYLSDRAAQALGITTGLLDILFFMLAFSTSKEAIKLTLDYLQWKKSPKRARKKLEKFKILLFELMLIVFNSSSMMTVLIGFSDDISFAVFLTLSLFVLGFGNLYMMTYSNEEAREGLHYLKNPEQSGLFDEIFKRRNKATALEILIEDIATTLPSAVIYYYVGQSIADSYKFPSRANTFFSSLVAGLTFIRCAFVFHPLVAERFLVPTRALQDIIETQEKTILDPLPLALKFKRINAITSELKESIREEKNLLKLATEEPVSRVQFFFRAAVVFAMVALIVFDPSPVNILIFMACASIAFVGTKANIDLSLTKNVLQKIDANHKESKEIKSLEKSSSKLESLVKALSILLTSNASLADLTVVMGALLIDNNATKLFLLYIALERCLKLYEFNYDKVEGTLRSKLIKENHYETIGVTQTSATLFHATNKAINYSCDTKVHPFSPEEALEKKPGFFS